MWVTGGCVTRLLKACGRGLQQWAIAASITLALTACSGDPVGHPEAAVWYVQSAAPGSVSEDGSRRAPFRSLSAVEAVSRPGDEIRVLVAASGASPLDGGIVLQAGQRLRGVASADRWPVITNTDGSRRGGDAVTLADGVVVTGIVIRSAAGHAILGRNVQGAVVRGNRIEGGNVAGLTSVTTGATAGLGVPEFPKAVVAFLHDEPSAGDGVGANTFAENSVTGLRSADGALIRLGGAGIALHAHGESRAVLTLSANSVGDLGPGFPRSGVLVDTQGSATATLEMTEVSVANAFESSDGILIVAQHQSSITATIRRYRYVGDTPGQGVGNNGLEVVTYHGGNWLQAGARAPEQHAATSRVILEDSDIAGSGGFGVAVWNIFGKPSPGTILDFGGGELGGGGRNRIYGSGLELPSSMDLYVVHADVNVANNWWGSDRSGNPKVVPGSDGQWQLGAAYAFACPGGPGQMQALIDGTGVAVWPMFCQAFSEDVCRTDEPDAACCDPIVDAARCLVPPPPSSVVSEPALVTDPRP